MLTLVDYVRAQAQWRAEKAAQYPDDERNQRSAEALRTLAEALEQMRGENGELIGQIEDLIREQRWGTPGRGVETAISRYGFDTEPAESSAFLDELLLAAGEDAERARAFDHLLPHISREAAAAADFCARNRERVGAGAALRARAVAERLARRDGLQIELENVRVLAELCVRDPGGEAAGTLATAELDLSEHFQLEEDVRALLGRSSLDAASVRIS